MKFNAEYPNKMSLLSKHSEKLKHYKRHLNKTNSCKSKSRSQMKSCQEKDQKMDKEKEEYLLNLRREAYNDLHAQLQTYNDDFIARMQYIESNSSVPLNESSCSTDTESSEMQSLVDMFEAGTVKDYSQLIEWESYQNPPSYFENQGEYGDLW